MKPVIFAPHLLGITPPALSMISAYMPQWQGEAAFRLLRVDGKENVGQLFRYELFAIDLQSRAGLLDPWLRSPRDASRTDADALFGQALGVCIELDGAAAGTHAAAQQRWRCINGVVTGLRYLDSDPQSRAIELRLEPWLALARLRNHYRIFQDQTVLQVVRRVLDDYAWPWDLRCGLEYPRLDYLVQYGESDFDFIMRLMAQWGLGYHFEHDAAAPQPPQGVEPFDGGSGAAADTPRHAPAHMLVITDAHSARPAQPCEAYRELPLQPRDDEHAEHEGPCVQSFETCLRLHNTRSQVWDYDFQHPRQRLVDDARSQLLMRALPLRDFTRLHWPAGFDAPLRQARSSEHLAQVRQWYAERENCVAQGRGRLRGLCAGHHFSLSDNPSTSDTTTHLVTHTSLHLQVAEARSSDEPIRMQVHCEFQTQCATRPLLVDAELDVDGPPRRPRVYGVQTAMVVAAPDNTVRTDMHGRVRVRFFWDRSDQACDECSCWVRVASPASGGAQGFLGVPRAGQEVVVAFEHGDPERPLIVGCVSGPVNVPNWELPAQYALSGWRSRELQDASGNHHLGAGSHLVFDDTASQLQVQLGSDHAHSALNLGRVTRIVGRTGRQDARGEGFELRTDAFGALRAGGGLSLSTDPRAHGIGRIDELQESGARLMSAAQQQQLQANAVNASGLVDAAQQSELADTLRTAAHTMMSGLAAQHADASAQAQADLNLGASGSLHANAARHAHLAAGEHVSVSSGGHTSLSAAGSLLASAAQGLRLFAWRAGLRLMARAGDVEIRALRDNLRLWARLRLEESAEHIVIHADKALLLQGASSAVELNGEGVHVHADAMRVHARMDMLPPGPLGLDLRGAAQASSFSRQLHWQTPAATDWGSLHYQMTSEQTSEAAHAPTEALGHLSTAQALTSRVQSASMHDLRAHLRFTRLVTGQDPGRAGLELSGLGLSSLQTGPADSASP